MTSSCVSRKRGGLLGDIFREIALVLCLFTMRYSKPPEAEPEQKKAQQISMALV